MPKPDPNADSGPTSGGTTSGGTTSGGDTKPSDNKPSSGGTNDNPFDPNSGVTPSYIIPSDPSALPSQSEM